MTTLININKNVSSSYAKIGSKLSYSITLENVSTTEANNVIVTDSIPDSLSFIPASLSGDGSNLGSGNQLTIYLTNMLPGALCTISFDATIDSPPNLGLIENYASVAYRYTLVDSLPNNEVGHSTSPTVQTVVKEAIINNDNFTKTATPSYVTSGDTINYDILLKNVGNVSANNVILIDTIPLGANFQVDSVSINGIPKVGMSPNSPTGITIGSISPNEQVAISFKLTVNTIPNIFNIENSATASFTYTIDDNNPNSESVIINSNSSNTTVNNAIIDNGRGFTKTVSPLYAKSTDTLTYTLVLTNTGNIEADNIWVKDKIPTGLDFIDGYLTINNVTIPNANPTGTNGLFVGFIPSGSTATVVYKVKINDLSNGNIFSSNSIIDYTFTVDPSVPDNRSYRGYSNIATVKVEKPIIENKDFTKIVDKNYTTIGDTLTYTFAINNPTLLPAINTLLIDTIPKELSLIENSILFNTETITNYNEGLSNVLTINIDTIPASLTSTLTFKAIVNTLPLAIGNISTLEYSYTPNIGLTNTIADGIITNESITTILASLNSAGYLKYSYKLDDFSDVIFSSSATSNSVNTTINEAIIDNTKGEFTISSTPFGTLDDEITYTITMRNTGNTDAININLFNTIPSGIKYIENSVYVGGINLIGINPQDGINIDIIRSGEKVTLSYKGRVDSIPLSRVIENTASVTFNYSLNPDEPYAAVGTGISNTATTNLYEVLLDINEEYKKYASMHKAFTYSFAISNKGNTPANNVIFSSTIPTSLNLVDNSVFINGINQGSINLEAGVNLGTIVEDASTTISFKVLTNSIPSINPVSLESLTTFTYGEDFAAPVIKKGFKNSNVLNTKINTAIIDSNYNGLIKSVNKPYADRNEVLTYTVNLKNTGNVPAENIILFDSIPDKLTFINNSIKVNGVSVPSQALDIGVNLGSLNVDEVSTITFDATVNSADPNVEISNSSNIVYDFLVDPEVLIYENDNKISNTAITTINYAVIDGNGFNIAFSQNPQDTMGYASIGDEVVYNITLTNSGNVTANNIIFKDTIPEGILIIKDSIEIDSTPPISYSINDTIEININSLDAGKTSLLKYSAIVTSLPNVNPTGSTGSLTFTYKSNNDAIGENTGYGYSNAYGIKVNTAAIDITSGGFTQTSSPSHVMVGDPITYTFAIKNTGNVDAANVVLINTIPSETSLIPGSISVLSDTLQTFSTPVIDPFVLPTPTIPVSVDVGNVNAGTSATVTLAVRLDTVPASSSISNEAMVAFSYTKNPSLPNAASGSGYSNSTTVNMVEAIIDIDKGFSKSVNKDFATLNDVLTYEIILNNTGTTSANNIVFTESIGNSLMIVANSISLNGNIIPNLSADSLTVYLGTVDVADTSTLSFQTQIVTIPSGNILNSPSNIEYTYTIDPSIPNSIIRTGISNIVTTTINYADINTTTFTITSSVDSAKLDDTITFKIRMENKGNVDAYELFLSLLIPNELELINGSIFLNNNSIALADFVNGLLIDSLPPSTYYDLYFDTKVIALPDAGFVMLTPTLDYLFMVNPITSRVASKSVQAVPLELQINEAIIDYTKGFFEITSDRDIIGVDESATITAVIKNTGNTIANNLVYINTLPSCVTLVENSVTLNGQSIAGSSLVEPQGLSLGYLEKGATAILSYKILAIDIPPNISITNSAEVLFSFKMNPNYQTETPSSGNSNSINISIIDANFNPLNGCFTISSNKINTHIDDTIDYVVTLNNGGNAVADNVILRLNSTKNTTIVPNSLTINSEPYVQAIPSFDKGINLYSISPKETKTIRFSETVFDNGSTLKVDKRGIVNYSFILDPTIQDIKNKEDITHTLSIPIKSAIMNNQTGGNVIIVDKQFVNVGGILTITSKLHNTGNITAYNVIVQSTLPNGIEFVDNSATIDGTHINGNIEAGINIGTLIPDQTLILVYMQKIISKYATILEAETTVTYDYTVQNEYNTLQPQSALLEPLANDTLISVASLSNAITVTVVDGSMELVHKVNKQFAYKKDILTYSVDIINIGEVLAEDVVILNTLPNSISFVDGSFKINSIPMNNLTPEAPFNIGNIPVSESRNFSFDAMVNTIPSLNPIREEVGVTYSYIVDPTEPKLRDSIHSLSEPTNIIGASIEYPDGGLVLAVDKTAVTYNDEITYTLKCKNTGNTVATNITVTSAIPKGLYFIDGSVTINSLTHLSSPVIGINIPKLLPQEPLEITFKVKVLPDNTALDFQLFATVKYNFIVDPAESPREAISNSNIVPVNFEFAKITLTYSSNTNVAEINSDIIYSISVKNIGNVKADNINIKSILPPSILYRLNSMYINGLLDPTGDITNGFIINLLYPDREVLLSFSATVKSLPFDSFVRAIATAEYDYSVSGSTKKTPNVSTSNETMVSVSLAFNNTKTIPTNSDGVHSCDESMHLYDYNYNAYGIATPSDNALISNYIKKYKMWTYSTMNFKADLRGCNVVKIESISCCLEIIRSATIKTVNSHGIPNIEGKFLTGYEQIVDIAGNIKIKYITKDGRNLSKEIHNVLPSYIVLNPNFDRNLLTVQGCFEDVNVVSMKNGILELSSLILLFMVSSNDKIGSDYFTQINTNDTGLSSSLSIAELDKFLSPRDRLWNEFNVCYFEELPFKISSLLSATANIKVDSIELLNGLYSPIQSSEGSIISGKKLMVNMTLKISLQYSSPTMKHIVEKIVGEIPCTTSIVLPTELQLTEKFVVDAKVENIYVCSGKNTIFTNATIIVKANQIC